MANIGDGFRDIFFAGIGALAITGEKTKELVDQLIAKGELTVDQGKQINSELKHRAEETASTVRFDVLEARMSMMTAEERTAFAAKAAEIAEVVNAREEKKAQEAAEAEAAEAEAAEAAVPVEPVAAEAAAPAAESAEPAADAEPAPKAE